MLKKRIVALLLAVCMLVIMCPQFAFAYTSEDSSVSINEKTGRVVIEGYVDDYVSGNGAVYIVVPAAGKTYADFAASTTAEELYTNVGYLGFAPVAAGGSYKTTFTASGVTVDTPVYVSYNGKVTNINGNSSKVSKRLVIKDTLTYKEGNDTVSVAVLDAGISYEDYLEHGDDVVAINATADVAADGSFECVISDAGSVFADTVVVFEYAGETSYRNIKSGEFVVIMYVDGRSGNDSNKGNDVANAFKTIAKAEAQYATLASMGYSADIILCGGTYSSIPLSVNAPDGATLSYIGAADKETVISGMTKLPVSAFRKVSDADIMNRLDANAIGHVYEIDLTKYGVSDAAFGETAANNYLMNSPGIYLNGKPQTNAKWPNAGYADLTVSEVTVDGDETRTFILSDEEFVNWSKSSNMYLEGIFIADRPWIREYVWINGVEPTGGTLEFSAPAYGGVGSNEAAGSSPCQLTINNALEAIDLPGEWYIDADNMMLYYYMPDNISDSDVLEIAASQKSLVGSSAVNAANIALRNLTLRGTYGPVVRMYNADNVTIDNCVIENASTGILIESGRNNVISNNSIRYIKGNAVWIKSGADPNTLAESANLVSSNHLYHCATVGTHGANNTTVNIRIGTSQTVPRIIGDVVENNVVHGTLHGEGLMYTGMDNEIRYNEFYNLIRYVSDAGVIYTGNKLNAYGTNIHHNYIHDFSNFNGLDSSNVGIYWDDYHSGQIAEYNIITAGRDGNNNTRALQTVGRDSTANHNLAVGLKIGYKFSDRNVNNFDTNDAYTSLKNVPEAITNKYPQILETKKSIDEDANKHFHTDGNKAYGNLHVDVTSVASESTALYGDQKQHTLDLNANQSYESTPDPDSYGNIGYEYKIPIVNKKQYVFASTKSGYDDIFVDHNNHDWRVKSSFISKYSTYLAANLLTDANFDMDTIGLKDSYYEGNKNEDTSFAATFPVNRTVESNGNVTLAWEKALYADKYGYEVATDASFSNVIASGTTFYNSVEITELAPKTKYYWRVRAINDSKEMDGSWDSTTGTATFVLGNTNYKVENVRFYAEDDTEITNMAGFANAAYMTYDFVNRTQSSVDYDIVVTLYNADGNKMKQVLTYTKNNTSGAGITTGYRVELEKPADYISGDLVYVLAWEDGGSITPITSKIIIK